MRKLAPCRIDPRDFWEVANRLGFGWFIHGERQGLLGFNGPGPCLCDRPNHANCYTKVARLHWYGKRIAESCEDLGGDIADVTMELWASGMVSTIWAMKTAAWLVDRLRRYPSHRAITALRVLKRHAKSRAITHGRPHWRQP